MSNRDDKPPDDQPSGMSLATRHRIAQRISQLLLIEIGTGVEVRRMVAQPLYARDVLLVCDAMRGTELSRLAEQYRAAEIAEAEIESAEPAPAPAPPADPRAAAPSGGSTWPRSWFRSSRGGKPK